MSCKFKLLICFWNEFHSLSYLLFLFSHTAIAYLHMLDSYNLLCKSAFGVSFILIEVSELWYLMGILTGNIMNVYAFLLCW